MKAPVGNRKQSQFLLLPLFILCSLPQLILVSLHWTASSLSAIFASIYKALQIAQSNKNTLA